MLSASRMGNLNSNIHRVFGRSLTLSPVTSKLPTYEQKLGIQPKPKRPTSTFIKYISDVIRPGLLKENPNIPITEVSKIASERWKAEDENVKKKFVDDYRVKMVAYREAMTKYTEELSTVDKKLLLKHVPKIKKEKKELKKKREELGCPKKPLSSYFLYLQSRRHSKPADSSQKDWAAKMAEDWRALSSADKEQFNRAHEAEKAAYAEKMSAWERDMRDAGHSAVLPKQTRTKPSPPRPS